MYCQLRMFRLTISSGKTYTSIAAFGEYIRYLIKPILYIVYVKEMELGFFGIGNCHGRH